MIKRSEVKTAQRRAFDMIRTAGIAVREEEREAVAVADFGLSRLGEFGGEILTLVETSRYGAKIIVLFPGQILPEHRHPPVGDDPGKEETVRTAWGTLLLYTDGPDTLKDGFIPPGKEAALSCRHERVMRPGDQVTFRPGEKHWFLGGPEGTVLYSFSSVVRDTLDGFTDPEVVRTTKIVEDV
jgi:D-lyxose ketol-isomerase